MSSLRAIGSAPANTLCSPLTPIPSISITTNSLSRTISPSPSLDLLISCHLYFVKSVNWIWIEANGNHCNRFQALSCHSLLSHL